MTRLEDRKARHSPRNDVEAETYQAYDWLKTANSAASMGQLALAEENLIHARDSIIRAIAKCEQAQKDTIGLGKNQKEFLKTMLEMKSWRNQGIGGWCQDSMSQTQNVVDSLVKRNLVKRRFNPSRFGRYEYVLTEEGKKLAESL